MSDAKAAKPFNVDIAEDAADVERQLYALGLGSSIPVWLFCVNAEIGPPNGRIVFKASFPRAGTLLSSPKSAEDAKGRTGGGKRKCVVIEGMDDMDLVDVGSGATLRPKRAEVFGTVLGTASASGIFMADNDVVFEPLDSEDED